MNKVLIVFKETYLKQVKSWAFFAMVFAPFLFFGITLGVGWLSGQAAASNSSSEVAVINQDDSLKQQLKKLDGFTTKYQDQASAEKAVKKEKLSGYVKVDLTDGQLKAVYKGREGLTEEKRMKLTTVLEAYQSRINTEQAGLSAEQTQALSRQISFKEHVDESAALEKNGKFLAFYSLVFCMYFILLIYITSTVQDIASEKGTKIMEVIFSSIPAPLYFYGRILGIFAVIATHIGIYAVGGVLAYQIAMRIDGVKGTLDKFQPLIDSILDNISLSTILFVVFGIFIYVILAALCGSLVTRAEDANKASQPLTYLMILGFLGVFILGQSGGDSLILKAGSYVPLISTFFMPVRSINGNAGAAESWLSLGILVVTALALVFYIGKSYAGLVLQMDDIGLWKSFKKGISSR